MKILIKKAHFILYILLTCGFYESVYSQDYESIYSQDCGTWVKDTIYYENWIDVDTINYNPKANTTWTYTEWRFVLNPEHTYAIFCPCGCGYADWEIRKRVNVVGIIQQQKRVTTYKYIESKFEKRLRLLQKICKHSETRKLNDNIYKCLKCREIINTSRTEFYKEKLK